MQCHEVTVKALVIMQPVKYFQWVFLQEKDPDADDLSSKEDEHENESDMASYYFSTLFKLEMTSFMFRTFQEAEDPGGQVVKKDNDREHKVFKVKSWQN